MRLVLGIDLGTSYFKLAVFDETGRLRGLARLAVPKQTGDAGRCELPVVDFWRLLGEGIAAACAEAGGTPGDIVALGYSSQANRSEERR